MTYVPERWNVCATCKWWRGRRQVKFIAAGAPPQVVVDGIMPGGSADEYKEFRTGFSFRAYQSPRRKRGVGMFR